MNFWQRLWARAKSYAAACAPVLGKYVRRYWRQLASLALAGGAVLQANYHFLPHWLVAGVAWLAVTLGIRAWQSGDPLPPPPDLPPMDPI